MESVHLQLPEDLLAQLDRARGDVPRNPWIRRAIEERLGATGAKPYRQGVPGPNVENVRSSAQIKRDVQERPKGGK